MINMLTMWRSISLLTSPLDPELSLHFHLYSPLSPFFLQHAFLEGLFAIRKSGFKDYPAIPKELDLVEREDQITFEIGLDEEVCVYVGVCVCFYVYVCICLFARVLNCIFYFCFSRASLLIVLFSKKVLTCIVWFCIVLCCVVLCCVVWFCIVFCCIVLSCGMLCCVCSVWKDDVLFILSRKVV